jgi:C1A family cysteine protease
MIPAFGLRGPDPDKHLFASFSPTVAAHRLPDNISYEYLCDPIQNQGQQGTCVTFACTELEQMVLRKRMHPVPPPALSKIGLYSLTKHLREPGSLTEQGLYAADALWVLQNVGYVLESDMPYRDDPNAIIAPVDPNMIHKDHELKGFQRVGGEETAHDALVQAMCLALFQHGPLAIGISYQNDWMQPEADGTLTPKPIQGAAGGHEMAVVGYSLHREAFRVRQSWGADFGDKGYVWLPFSSTVLPDDVYTIAI